MTHTTVNGLVELAERLEAATGPDRELDARVIEACGWRRRNSWWGDDYWDRGDDRLYERDIPKVTASIDAAKALMPEGMIVEVYQQSGDSLNWMTKAIFPDHSFVLGYGFTEEGSRCAAALRARAESRATLSGERV